MIEIVNVPNAEFLEGCRLGRYGLHGAMNMTNEEFFWAAGFLKDCHDYGVKATKRQVSKYRRGKGILYRKIHILRECTR